MALADKTASELTADEKKKSEVFVTELTPNHMFKAIKTTLRFSGSSWMVSDVERLLSADGCVAGAELSVDSNSSHSV
jgi:outer membrane lipoprotein-sorting protein